MYYLCMNLLFCVSNNIFWSMIICWDNQIIQVILFEIDCAIFYTNLHELFCQFISWTNWVNFGKYMDNCWIPCQVMADMKKIYNDLIIINLYWQWNLKTSKLKLFWVVLELFFGFFGFFKLWYPKLLTTYPNFSPVNHKEHWNIPKIPRLFFQKWWFFLVFREKPCKVGRNSKLQLEGMTEIKY